MPLELSEPVRDLIDAKNFCIVSTLRKDGSPQMVAVWASRDGDAVLLNTARGRAWPKNLARDDRIGLLVHSSENPYEFVHINGRCVELTEDGADDHIDALAKKYMDVDSYPYRQAGERRLTARIEADRVYHFDGPKPLPVATSAPEG